jgi:hypothetical protein
MNHRDRELPYECFTLERLTLIWSVLHPTTPSNDLVQVHKYTLLQTLILGAIFGITLAP